MSALRRTITMAAALSTLLNIQALAEIERANAKPESPASPPKPRGNPSGHMPHQGKREMARRMRRAK